VVEAREKKMSTETSSRQSTEVLPDRSGSLGFSDARRKVILLLWAVLICCVVIGSLLPAASPLMVAIGRLHINDKAQHFCAYLALSLLPVIGFRDRRRGITAAFSMFLLGILMEAGQHFSPGRAVELGDVIANGAGVSCGVLLAPPIRTLIAIL
jgi:VanZ like family